MASNMSVMDVGNVKVYNLSQGKTMPEWLNERTRRKLSQDPEFRRRIEIIQDFNFPSSSQCIQVTNDNKYCICTGVYKPVIKTFEFDEMSMKFERFLDSEVVQFLILEDDYRKLAFLTKDRGIEFHAAWGFHYKVRIPKSGRDLAFDRGTCDLLVASSTSEIYRLNLEQGRFLSSIDAESPEGVNAIELNLKYSMLGCAGEDGVLRLIDPRSRSPLASLDITSSLDLQYLTKPTSHTPLTALTFSNSGLNVAVGTGSGHTLVYDLRSSSPLYTKQHQNELPIHSVRYHGSAEKQVLLSAGPRVVKIWDAGKFAKAKTVCNVESMAPSSDLCMCPDSGMLFMSGQQERIMVYYIPALGPAPAWCHFLDSITEELEEADANNAMAYDNYKFISASQLETLGLTHLIGTDFLKGHMHGYFMDARFYRHVTAANTPFDYATWRKERIQARIEKRDGHKIVRKRKVPLVNKELAEELRAKQRKAKKRDEDTDEDGEDEEPLVDERFGAIFNNKAFEIDRTSEAYALRHPEARIQVDKSASSADQYLESAFAQAKHTSEDVDTKRSSSLKMYEANLGHKQELMHLQRIFRGNNDSDDLGKQKLQRLQVSLEARLNKAVEDKQDDNAGVRLVKVPGGGWEGRLDVEALDKQRQDRKKKGRKDTSKHRDSFFCARCQQR